MVKTIKERVLENIARQTPKGEIELSWKELKKWEAEEDVDIFSSFDIEETIDLTLQEVMEAIETLENPYPEDIFTEPTKYEMNLLKIFCIDNKITQDKLFGSFGRKVWDNCKDELKKSLEGER